MNAVSSGDWREPCQVRRGSVWADAVSKQRESVGEERKRALRLQSNQQLGEDRSPGSQSPADSLMISKWQLPCAEVTPGPQPYACVSSVSGKKGGHALE